MSPGQDLLRIAYQSGFTYDDIVQGRGSRYLTEWCKAELLVSYDWLLSYYPEWLAESEYLSKVKLLSLSGNNLALYMS